MDTKKLGFSDMEFTRIGLGTWAIGGPWEFGWGPQDDQDSLKTIHEAIDEGINWIDTAAIYGLGHSEEMVGKAVKGMSKKPYIATKCGLIWDSQRDRIPCLEPASIMQECENSLKRLGVEVIDLYQIHHPIADDKVGPAWEAVNKLIKQGKVRYGGVSNFTLKQLQICQTIAPIASLQPHYSMLFRYIEDEIMGYCKENQIGIISYCPMARGLLTGKFDHKRLENLAPDDSRLKSDMFKEPAFSKNLEFVEKLKPIAARNNITLAQLSIVWVLRGDEVTSAIVGARRPGQIVETAKAGSLKISNNDIQEIEELIKEL